jgi:hypothetical protein
MKMKADIYILTDMSTNRNVQSAKQCFTLVRSLQNTAITIVILIAGFEDGESYMDTRRGGRVHVNIVTRSL